jgi:hypothetical protein
LYEIVNGFQLIVWPLLNLVEVTTAMIWFFSAVKPDDPSVRHGTTASQSRYGEETILNLGEFDGRGAFHVVVSHAIDPCAYGIAPHQPSIVGLQ